MIWDAIHYYIFGNNIALLIIFPIMLKIWVKASTGVFRSKKRMDGKTVIVTGANTGIGKETALELAKRGARVILGCRDLERGKKAQDEIIVNSGNKNVVLHKLDLSSLNSVREFAQTIINTESHLEVLINNAGCGGLPYKKTADGLDLVMQTNYFGPFLLTVLLLGLLKKSAPSRIVVVSSVLHYFSTLRVENINDKKPFHYVMAYNDSKMANILMANELARKLKGTGVTCNSLHPGVIKTDIWRNAPFAGIVMKLLFGIFWKNVNEGAQTTLYLAVSEEVEGVSGKYFVDCKEASTRRTAQDIQLAKKLWEKSEELVKLQPSEKLYL
ncbi:retinol dehydrogenase 11 [Anabrus simplex]|uniref:retinol dehydrogenase 11 n=1 Tax=Anabrus simplex TaxID=316456 RepID=UPI0035A372DB